MPHEKIISGDLDGDGVEGHRKKITGGEFPRKEREEHDFGQVVKKEEKAEPRQERSKTKESDDPFYTGFGSAKPRDEKVSQKSSVIGGDSDIFDTGFGSATQKKREKMVSAGRVSSGKRGDEYSRPVKKVEKSSSFGSDEMDELFESPERSFAKEPEQEKERKKGSKLDNDPFYTGFGYTDQRGKDSPADGGLFPEGDTLPEMPEKELIPKRWSDEEPSEEEPEPAKVAPEEKAKTEEKPKRQSVLTRDDDDLFS